MNTISVNVKNIGRVELEKGGSLHDLISDIEKNGRKICRLRVLGAKVNNQIRELSYIPTQDDNVIFIDLDNADGLRIYTRSLHFVYIKALKELYPEKKTVIKHAISRGIYFEIIGEKEVTVNEVSRIRSRMREIIKRKIPFIKYQMTLDEAKRKLLDEGSEYKFHLIEHREKTHVSMYDLDGMKGYYYGYMVPDTGYLERWHLCKYKYGVVIVYPDRNDPSILPDFKPQPMLFEVIREHEIDGRLLGCGSLGELNKIIKDGKVDDLIEKSEYLHSIKIRDMASEIAEKRHKVVLIAGPSSSGKTSTALRLAKKLNEMSIKTITISMDDYYINKVNIPLDENGDKDFESIKAVDLWLFKENIKNLLSGNLISKPVFNFMTGMREKAGVDICIGSKDVIIVEGIHGLNPETYKEFSAKQVYKIYVSALTSMNIDDHNRIPTTDTRLIRRMVRDKSYRNTAADGTLMMWGAVRRGEERNIFPYQENADAIFNTSLYYELAILKPFAEEMIKEVTPDHAEYAEAKRLKTFLGYVYPAGSDAIPDDSILKEFTGGSSLFK